MAWTQKLDGGTVSPEKGNSKSVRYKCRKQAPWRSLRKCRNQEDFDFIFYNWTSQNFEYTRGVEACTSNKFQILSEEDKIQSQEDVLLPNFYNIMLNNDVKLLNKNYYVYNKNVNVCSGYFPSPIPLDYNNLESIPQNNDIKNINNNSYLRVKNKKYLKQMVNKNSKYNFSYFNDMKEDFQISNFYSKQLGVLNLCSQKGGQREAEEEQRSR